MRQNSSLYRLEWLAQLPADYFRESIGGFMTGTSIASDQTNAEKLHEGVNPVDMKLEVVLFSVSDVDRAKAFYEKLGWRLDIDMAAGDFRGVQITPHNSQASIIFGRRVTSTKPSSRHSLVLAVHDVDAARAYLVARGIKVSEVFHYGGGPFNNSVPNPRVSGRDPERRSYFSFASFEDPDGNEWLRQEITMRLPGREWAAEQA
jgi:catechol 2,3-dioxygenase-like lactoylglutathione lyase family enzyme